MTGTSVEAVPLAARPRRQPPNPGRNQTMSAAAAVPETFPRDGARACHILVICEDAAAHDSAREVCARLVGRLEPELPLTFSFWQFKDLDDPVSAGQAAAALECADIILFSVQGNASAGGLSNWLDLCALAQTKADRALALLIRGHSDAEPTVEALVSRMRSLAQQLRMDFLPLASVGRDSSNSFPALSSDNRLESGGTHWGLNE